MVFLIPCDFVYEPVKVVHEYHVDHKAAWSSSDEESSEGMTNDRSSCWMISVIQALRASAVFQNEYAPVKNEKNNIKNALFHLFDVVDGKNGQVKRRTSSSETIAFKKLLIKNGLGVGMNEGFFEKPFLQFLLKNLDIDPIRYQYGKKRKEKQSRLLRVPLALFTKPKELQQDVDDQKIEFAHASHAPRFLPIYLDRPEEKRYYDKKHYRIEYARVPVIPNKYLYIRAGNALVCYELVSIVIGRDSLGHAYTYEVSSDESWIEFNDERVIRHEAPFTKKKRLHSNLTAFDDACKHAGILIYQRMLDS
jgi:hypothetical protein